MSKTKVNITNDNLEHIVLNDIKQMDGDAFRNLVEYLYGVNVSLNEDETYTIEPNDDNVDLSLKDIFGDNFQLFKKQ